MPSKKIQEMLDYANHLGIVNNSNQFAEEVKAMEAEGQFVYYVIDGDYILGGVDEVHMTTYLFVSKYDEVEQFKQDLNDGYAFARVVNTTWGIDELGSIGYRMREDGSLSRTA